MGFSRSLLARPTVIRQKNNEKVEAALPSEFIVVIMYNRYNSGNSRIILEHKDLSL